MLGCTLTRWFGISEGVLSFTRRDDPAEVRFSTEGRPLCPADEIRIVDEAGAGVALGQVGELLLRGPYTLRGYYRVPEHNGRAFTADGFFRTGDLVRRTREGNLVVEGRIKDVINRGGEKVAADEVEEHARAHAAIRDAVVVAIPDSVLGEKTCLVVIPDDGYRLTLREVRQFLVARGLATYKLPDRLETVHAFPYTPVGKVDKPRLRQTLLDGPTSPLGPSKDSSRA
jgi:2,3-dihydroxybenzoate-AMP ligase